MTIEMQPKLARLFLYSSGFLLMITATAKIVSSVGSVRVLQISDPVFGIQFRHLFLIVGGIEMIVCGYCFFGKRVRQQIALVSLLATNFLIYRLGMWFIGWHRPCPCLGNLTDALHILPQTADTAMKIILAYLLIGSYATLFWLWRQHRKVEGRMMND